MYHIHCAGIPPSRDGEFTILRNCAGIPPSQDKHNCAGIPPSRDGEFTVLLLHQAESSTAMGPLAAPGAGTERTQENLNTPPTVTRIVRRRIRADTVELFSSISDFQNFCYSTTPAAPFGARMDLGVIRKCELDKILLTLIVH